MKLEYSTKQMTKESMEANEWAKKASTLFDNPKNSSFSGSGTSFPLLALGQAFEKNFALFESLSRVETGDWNGSGLVEWIYECSLVQKDNIGEACPLVIAGDPSLSRCVEALASGHPVALLVPPTSLIGPFFKAMTEEASFEKGIFLLHSWEEGNWSALPSYLEGIPIHYTPTNSYKAPSLDDKWVVARSGSVLPSVRMGGASAFVLDSADLDSAVEAIVSSTTYHNGYSVFRAPRVWIQEAVFQLFTKKLLNRISKLVIGKNKNESGCDAVDTQESKTNLDKICHLEGVEVLSPKGEEAPLVLTSFPPDINPRDGLLLLISTFRTSKELLSLAQPFSEEDAFIFSEDMSQAMELIHRLENQTIHVNVVGGTYFYRKRGCFPNKSLTYPQLTQEGLEAHFTKKGVLSIDQHYVNASKASGTWLSTNRTRRLLQALGSVGYDLGNFKEWIQCNSGEFLWDRSNTTTIEVRDPVGIVTLLLEEDEKISSWLPFIVRALSVGNVVILAMSSKCDKVSSLSEKLGKGILSVVHCEDFEKLASGVAQRRDRGLTVYVGKSIQIATYLRYKAIGRVWIPESSSYSKDESFEWVTQSKKIHMSCGTIFAN